MRYAALLGGYAVACAILLAASSRQRLLWPRAEPSAAAGPRLPEVMLLLVGVIAIGQLYQQGMLLTERGSWREAARTVNQLLIFAPIFARLAMAVYRGRSRAIALAPVDHLGARLAIGIATVAVAVAVYLLILPKNTPASTVIERLFSARSVAFAVQILGEDLGIGLLLASLARHVRPQRAVLASAMVFAAAHIPAMIKRREVAGEFIHLVGDAGLAALAVAVVFRLRDVFVLWPVHVALDLMQFYA
jgi:hypothetical protein